MFDNSQYKISDDQRENSDFSDESNDEQKILPRIEPKGNCGYAASSTAAPMASAEIAFFNLHIQNPIEWQTRVIHIYMSLTRVFIFSKDSQELLNRKSAKLASLASLQKSLSKIRYN